MPCLGGPTKFYYDDSGNLIGMRQNYDQPIKFQVNYATGEIDGFTQGTNTYWYRKNQQGDVTGIFSINYGNTALFVEYEYDAWGNVISITGDGASTIGAINPIRYRGYFYDTETGYYYLNSRYYDPVTHRFLNGDVFASTGQGVLGCNMFAYCLNNPVAYGDPTGMIVKTVICNDGGGGISSVEREEVMYGESIVTLFCEGVSESKDEISEAGAVLLDLGLCLLPPLVNNAVNAVYYNSIPNDTTNLETNSDASAYVEKYETRWDRLKQTKCAMETEYYSLDTWLYYSEYSVHAVGWYATGWAENKDIPLISGWADSFRHAGVVPGQMDKRMKVRIATIIWGVFGY